MSLDKELFFATCSKSDDASASYDLSLKNDEPAQPRLESFAPKQYGKRLRDFLTSWYKGRPWLEFSVKEKAAFCFCYRHFSQTTSEQQFKFSEYRNCWQHAFEKTKRFAKHATSAGHVQAALFWEEQHHKIINEQSVSTLVHEKQIQRNM